MHCNPVAITDIDTIYNKETIETAPKTNEVKCHCNYSTERALHSKPEEAKRLFAMFSCHLKDASKLS